GPFDIVATLEIRNDQPVARMAETAFSAIPLAREAGVTETSRMVVVAGDRWLQAQMVVRARWGGPVSDTTLPIRWLEVVVPSDVGADEQLGYELRHYRDAFQPPADALAVSVTDGVEGWTIENGVARFEVGRDHPALLSSVSVSGETIYAYDAAVAAGPHLTLEDGTELSSAGGNVVVDDTQIVEQGPVRVVVAQTGHFSLPSHPDAFADCAGDTTPYDRFGFTVVATFTRGSRDIGLRYHVRNECSEAFGEPWTDQAVVVREVGWRFPLTGSLSSGFASGSGAVVETGEARVEQTKAGDDQTWTMRRAAVSSDGNEVESSEALDRPMVAGRSAAAVVSLQMPWMRFREPQAVAFENGALSMEIVSDRLVFGEAKGIWGVGLLKILPAGTTASELATHRDRGQAELERGLLVRRPLAELNATGVYPSMGDDGTSALKDRYEATLAKLHDDTVNRQWSLAKTYGSQLWPDIQYDPYSYDDPSDIPNPYANDAAMNYWNPSGAELLEFFRTGDPKWVWDFALPQSYLQLFSAYVNIGDRTHGNRNGFAATSGGFGEGQWHRSGFGSADYSYNSGMDEAFAIRPDPLIEARFRQAGTTLLDIFTIPQSAQETRWDTNFIEVSRFQVQRYNMLANCAEFVRGEVGAACHEKLVEVMAELEQDNLASGSICEPDIPSSTTCDTPQQFMLNSLMYPAFMRHFRNYGGDTMGRMLIRAPQNLLTFGMDRNGAAIDVAGCWAAAQSCTLSSDGGDVMGCVNAPDSDGQTCMYPHNKPQTLSLLMMASELDPSQGMCSLAKAAFDDPGLYGGIDDNVTVGGGAGWWKGAAQMMQSLVFGVGGYDTCD
ncbi:MAG: hypothetical protein KC731_29040, partial [Myxococcales bacterium]|nr:hypothetical protein [Myxococcales bacterium]